MSQKTARSEARSEAQTQLFSNLPTCPQEIPLPLGSTAEPFGCHNIFRKAVFPLWPTYCIFCDMSQFTTPPPHPHPLSGAQIRSITAPRNHSRGGCGIHAGRHGNGRGRPERTRGLPNPCGLQDGHLPRRGGHDSRVVHPEVGTVATGVLAGAKLRGTSGSSPDVPRRGPLWGWHAPRLCHGPGGPPTLPGLSYKRGHYAIALDNGPKRPRRCGDTGAAGGRPDMAPPPPLLLSPPGDLPGSLPALPNGVERLVAGSGLNSGAGRL